MFSFCRGRTNMISRKLDWGVALTATRGKVSDMLLLHCALNYNHVVTVLSFDLAHTDPSHLETGKDFWKVINVLSNHSFPSSILTRKIKKAFPSILSRESLNPNLCLSGSCGIRPLSVLCEVLSTALAGHLWSFQMDVWAKSFKSAAW